MKLNHCIPFALLAMASPVAAQDLVAGSVTFKMSLHVPDSLKMPVPVGPDITILMSARSDGRRVAMDIDPGASVPVATGASVRVIFATGSDTVHVGVLLPPALAAAAGGGSGVRVDVPLSVLHSANPMLTHLMDSMKNGMSDSIARTLPHPTYRSLHTNSVVAGISCEEWETVAATDTIHTCVIPTPPFMQAMKSKVLAMSGVSQMMERMPGLADLQKEAYGGRDMTAIRTVMSKFGMRMELVSVSGGAPDPALLELPAGLQPMPMPALPTKPGGGGAQE